MTREIQLLVDRSNQQFNRVTDTISRISDADFFYQPADKWSVAQHLQHLTIATSTSTAAFALPKFLVRLIGGQVNSSRTYEQLVADYRSELENGAKASGRYLPGTIDPSVGKERIISKWLKSNQLYIESLSKQKEVSSLEKIAVKHPILKKISLLELAYFTIYHTEHHLNLIVILQKEI